MCKRGLSDLNRAAFDDKNEYQGGFKRIKVTSSYPLRMLRRDKEKDLALDLCPPPEFAYARTANEEKNTLDSHDVKNLKAEEKRIYEIQNCEISEKMEKTSKGSKIEEEKTRLNEKEYTGKNPLDNGSKLIGEIGIYEISNSQMF